MNKQEAIRLFRAAAFQGYAPAQFDLGMCHLAGSGVEKNKLMAACLFKITADPTKIFEYFAFDLKQVMLDVCD